MTHRLLEKTELWIRGIVLEGADLNEIAKAVADILGISPRHVLVTDYQCPDLALDVLAQTIDPAHFAGRKNALFERLLKIAGVKISSDADIGANGMLGWLAADPEQSGASVARSAEMIREINSRIQSRAIVFSTGSEVAAGQIRDTNTPLICALPGKDRLYVNPRPHPPRRPQPHCRKTETGGR